MLPIEKFDTDPQLLVRYKANNPEWAATNSPYETFSSCDTRAGDPYEGAFTQLREQLLEEQKYVCAYCGQSIKSVSNASGSPLMKTEHFIPKEDVSLQLEYRNLLACCLGNQNERTKDRPKPKPELHCDSSKGASRLKALPNPATIAHRDEGIEYDVYSEEAAIKHALNKDIDEDLTLKNRLNLNEFYLKRKRYTAYRVEIEDVLGQDENHWSREQVQQLRDHCNDCSDGHHKEFKDFLLWKLDQFLRPSPP